ncbi:MAG: response regulator, partial [Thermodesulfobacteriota bacterium]|nr:response regulator [Thermodesulfobacteriota bacterium]
ALLKNIIPGCEVITALSGEEGIKKAKAESPDTILLDIIMPGMDGYETCRRLRKDKATKHIPIIMVTAIKTGSESLVKGLECGADAYLAKPIDEYVLVAQINTALRVKEAEDRLRNAKDRLGKMVEERTRALKESEEKSKALINAITEVAVLIDTQGIILASNEILAKRFEKSLDELIGSCLYDLFPAKVAENKKAQAQHVIQTGNHARFEDKREGRIYDNHYYPVFDTQGKVTQITIFALDITERYELQKEHLKTEKLESVGILAGGIAHDFNNILTVILGNLSLAKMYGKQDDKSYELLLEAERASLRAKDLTQQLLTFSKGGEPVKSTAFISDLIEESARFALRGSRVKPSFSMPDDLWPAEIDQGQISQVVSNFVINADQAMPDGGVIHIRAENVAIGEGSGLPLKPGRHVRFSVKDEGLGISGEHLGRIFDPYFTTKQHGSGLGLAIIHSIIRKHDGHITVESEIGAGTTFHVYLPAADKEMPEMEYPEADLPLAGKQRILIMDDEASLRGLVHEILSQLDYETESAENGDEAVDMYRKAMGSGQPFDAVILDLTVPGGMGGKEAVKKLLEIDPGVKAIVSSGYSSDPVMSDFRRFGFRGVIAKPYDVRQLSEMLYRVLTEVQEQT